MMNSQMEDVAPSAPPPPASYTALESQASIDSATESRTLLRGISKTAQSHHGGGPSRRALGSQGGGIAADWPAEKSLLSSYSKSSGSKWDVVRLDIYNRVRSAA